MYQGAEVVRMYKTLLGSQGFRKVRMLVYPMPILILLLAIRNCLILKFLSYKFPAFQGMDLYFKRHDGQAVTCEDFFAAMRDANNADFANFLLWLVSLV